MLVCGCADTPPPFSFVCCRVRSYMFYGASSFNGDLSKWEVSGVTSMQCVCVARGEQRGADACWSAACADTPPPFSSCVARAQLHVQQGWLI